MEEIKALIRTHRMDAVLAALHTHSELPGVTISLVRGFGRTVGRSSDDGDMAVQFGTVEMAKIECVVNDDAVDAIVELIQQAAHTGRPGDGKIFIYGVREVVKVRTGQRLQRIE